ncbi:MAG TPA: RusA family crossover junction endodeoxyribonuclease [Trueperaceae bacterium]
MTLELPWPPTLNTSWRRVGNRTVLSAKARRYRADVLAAVAEQGSPRLGTARLAVTLTLHPPDRRRMDVDNRAKPALDALEFARVYANDSQIDRLTIVRAEPRQGGALTVQIEEIPGDS